MLNTYVMVLLSVDNLLERGGRDRRSERSEEWEEGGTGREEQGERKKEIEMDLHPNLVVWSNVKWIVVLCGIDYLS